MNITLLTENRARKRGIKAEHGLSVYIESKDSTILFDCGQSDVYLHNAKILGIDVTKADCIVLSHGHYDHCGGLRYFGIYGTPPVYMRDSAFVKKYKYNENYNNFSDIGIPWEYQMFQNSIRFTDRKTQIAANAYTVSEVPYKFDFETVSDKLYKNTSQGDMVKDEMNDEQLLVIETEKGLVVFTGCSHPGICNCLQYVEENFGGEHINTIIGGFHLEGTSDERMEKTKKYLTELNFEHIIPVHCTGIKEIINLKDEFGDRCTIIGSGESFTI